MKGRIFAIGLLACVTVLKVSPTCRCAPEEVPLINFMSEATVAGKEVRLAEIAEFAGFDPDELKRTKRIRICNAPPPGEVRELSGDWLNLKMLALGYEDGKVKLTIPDQVVLRGASQLIEKSLLLDELEAHMRGKGWVAGENFEIVEENLPEEVEIGPGEFHVSVETPWNVKIPGNTFVTFKIKTREGETVVRTRCRTRTAIEIPVAGKSMKRGDVLARDDFMVEKRWMERVVREPASGVKVEEGWRLKRSVKQGEMITWNDLEPKPVVERGDIVTMRIVADGFTLSGRSTAMEDGLVGQTIRVKNLDSGKIVKGRVENSELIIIRMN